MSSLWGERGITSYLVTLGKPRVIGQPRKRLGLPKERATYQVNQKAQITRHTCRK